MVKQWISVLNYKHELQDDEATDSALIGEIRNFFSEETLLDFHLTRFNDIFISIYPNTLES